MPVDEGTSRRRTGLEGAAPAMGSNTGPSVRPAPDNGAKSRAMELEGAWLKGEEEGSRSVLGAGRPLAAGLRIATGKIGVGLCTDGEAGSSKEGATELTGDNWVKRFGDWLTSWIAVVNELTAWAAADRIIGGGCTNDAARVGEAGAPDETRVCP